MNFRLSLSFILLLLSAALFPGISPGQSNFSGGQNIISYSAPEWKHVSTDNFDIHYYGTAPFMAAEVSRYAEEALYDISLQLDYRYRSRFALFLYLTPEDLISSHRYPDEKMREGGFSPLKTNSRNLLFSGSHASLQKQVREAVAGLLMDDFYFGGSLQASIQNTVLMHLPKWYSEGFPAYVGEGWTFEDEMWLTSLKQQNLKELPLDNLLELALDGNEPINRVVRKSIWYYIADQNGESKLSEVFYMTRLTRSVESGVLHVLGKTMKTFTDDWRSYILKRIEDNKLSRMPQAEAGQLVKLPEHERLISFTLHPKEAKAAVWLEHEGVYRLAIADLKSGALRETGLRAGYRTDQLGHYNFELPVAWSPDGSRIVTAFREKELYTVAVIETSTLKVTRGKNLGKSVDRIYSLSWNHAGTELVCSALLQGNIDIFTFRPTDQKFTRVTNDAYDDLSPVWDMDDASILYSSNHGNDTIAADMVDYRIYHHDLDVFQYNPDSKEPSRQVTHTPGINEYPVAMVSSFELLVRSDAQGIYNLEKVNIFLGESNPVTNVDEGFYRVSRTDTLLAWSAPLNGNLALSWTGASYANEPREVLVTPLRSQIEFFELQKRLEEERKARIKNGLPSVHNPENEASEEADSAAVDTGSSKVKYYVFDEEESKPRVKKKKVTVRFGPGGDVEEDLRPNFAGMKLNGPSGTQSIWSADEITTQFQWDPAFRLGMLFQARLTDLRGYHQFVVGYRPFIDLKSADVYATFNWLRHRPDYYAGIYRNARHMTRSDFLLRYQVNGIKGGVVYPINRYASVGVEGNLNYIRRTDLNPFLNDRLDGTDIVAGGTANFTYSKLKTSENFIQRGIWLQVEEREAYSLSSTNHLFAWTDVDARKYTPIMSKMVLATRLTSGFSIGPQRRNVFMGGTSDWLFGRLDNASDLPFNNKVSDFAYSTFVTPVRGFSYNARNGTQYVAANIELRLPISRMLAEGLNSNPAYSLEFVPFFDFGTVWSQGNPLSQRNPIDSETINSYPVSITVQTLKSPFIMGVGAGTRLMVVGYSMRFDLAWGIEDQTLIKPRLYMSLGKDF